jgi:hypothetical protein
MSFHLVTNSSAPMLHPSGELLDLGLRQPAIPIDSDERIDLLVNRYLRIEMEVGGFREVIEELVVADPPQGLPIEDHPRGAVRDARLPEPHSYLARKLSSERLALLTPARAWSAPEPNSGSLIPRLAD